MKKVTALLFFFLISISFTSLAQDVEIFGIKIQEKIISEIYTLAFILFFVLLLLWAGGVIKRPSIGGGNLTSLIALLLTLVFLFFLPKIVKYPGITDPPADFKKIPLPGYVGKFLQFLGLPESWNYVPALIYLFILPFAGIYTVVWAFLSSLAIFPQRNVNRILALVITLLTIPMGSFIRIVWLVFSFAGLWSVVMFGAIFILGIFFRGAKITAKEYIDYKKQASTIRETYKDAIKKLEGIKGNSLDQIRKNVNSLLTEKSSLLPSGAVVLLQEAIQAKNPKEAREKIDTAIKFLKNQL